MKKSLLGVVLCVALLLSAVSAMLAMPASAAEANLLDGNYALDQGGDGSATGTLTDGVLTITNTAAGEVGVNLGDGMNLNATPDFVISVDSDVAFNIAFFDANNNKWFNLAADWYPLFGGDSNAEQIAAGSYSDIVVTLTGAYTWDATIGGHNPDLLSENAAVTGMYICPKAAGTMTISKLAFVGEGGDDTSTTESTETTESTTEATESTTEATTTTTEATTAIPEDAFIVYTIETVEHAGPIAAGEQVQVKVSTSEAANIAGIGLNIGFDSSILKAVSAEEQGWFAGLGMSDINVMESEIRMSCMDLNGATSAEGEVIAVLTFEALAEITEDVALYALTSDVVSTDVTATVVGHCTDGGIVIGEATTAPTTSETEPDVTEPSTSETEPSTTETEPSATETTASATETTATTATTASTTKADESPKTGDASNALLLVVIAAAAAVVLTVSVKKAQAR